MKTKSGSLDVWESWEHRFSDLRRILDLGSGEHRGFSLKTRARIVLVDVQTRFHPDVAADAQVLPFKPGSFDGALAVSVLEHVPRPWDAVREIHRVLQPGGVVLGYVPFMWPYHADVSFHDYYRFSDEGVRALFRQFESIQTIPSGGYTNTLFRFSAGFTASQRHLQRLERITSLTLAGLARATGIWGTTRVNGLLRSATGFNFLAQR